MSGEAYIHDVVRTPRAKAVALRPIDLLAEMYRAIAERKPGAMEYVGDVILGISSQVGSQGANLAKISAIYAGLTRCSGGTTNRFCCSGLDAIAQAALKVRAGDETAVLAGGVEKCSEVSMFADNGAWFADPEVAKKTGFVHMGVAADRVAASAGIAREALDAYAVSSHQRAAAARDAGAFAKTLVAVGGVTQDELIRERTTIEKLAALPPLFGGVHTIGTSPQLADAAAMALISSTGAGARARIRAVASATVDPAIMLTGNVAAVERALVRAGIGVSEVDLFEVNESFAAIPLHFMRALGVPAEKLNVCGGAIALGHPLGATGVILVGTLLDALEARGGSVGVVSICGGAGLAQALVVERV